MGLCAALLLAFGAAPAWSAEEGEEGFHTTPDFGWDKGDHHVDAWVKFRYRWEIWDARAAQPVFQLPNGAPVPGTGGLWKGAVDNFHGFQTRFGASYAWKDKVKLLVEGQHAAVVDLSTISSGVGGLYYGNNGRHNTTSGVNVKRGFLVVKPIEQVLLKAGRQRLDRGTAGWVKYSKPNWKYVKYKRMSQRLVGTVDWTNGTRSYDAGFGDIDINGQKINFYVGQPTRGVLEIRDALKPLSDVIVGGIDWTSPAGTLVDNVEFGAFFMGYGDDRFINQYRPAPNREKVDLEIYTFGGSALGIFPIGPGNFDAMIWGAFQWGKYGRNTLNLPALEHLAGALLAEFGYQLDEVYGKPWLRTGVNYASGDGNSWDGKNKRFFNLLPTNHLYYGFVDQLAFSNLVDWFIQLKWSPIEKLSLNLMVHRYWLATKNDGRWFGSGAFSPNNFGYGVSPSRNSNDVGWELDIIASYQINQWVSLAAGFGELFGGDVFRFAGQPAGTWGNDGNVQWGFVQAVFKY
jgi:hypothetical protein